MKFLPKIFFVFFSITTVFSQTQIKKQYEQIEDFVLKQQIDSAQFYLNKLKEPSDYAKLIEKVISSESLTYKEYNQFLARLWNRPGINFNEVSNFVNSTIEPPTNFKEIDPEYIELKWIQVTNLREATNLAAASEEQTILDNYIERFDQRDEKVQEAKLKVSTHQIVMYQIQRDVVKGKKLCLENLESARKLQNKRLQITFLYHLSDFLMIEKNLDEYIKVCEEALKIEEHLNPKSSYHIGIVEHLIDSYIYKGGYAQRVKELLDALYDNPQNRFNSYQYYAKLLGKNPNDKLLIQDILKKFEVKNIAEFAVKIINESESKITPNDYLQLLFDASEALAAHKFYDLALKVKQNLIFLTRKTYSEDLAKTLASYETAQAVKQKNLEISFEQKKSRLTKIIAILIGVLFLIAIFIMFKFRKQSKLLKAKNKLINKTLKEKELLVKEVHHRVKNNFQVVSSLLELQSKGIEDKKALELANEGKNRVKSMALIHQKLYQNDTGLVDFDEYIRQLVKELSSLNTDGKEVETNIKSEHMFFDVDTAIPLGLIINEIITNSYKYAFSKDKSNTLDISIQKDSDEDYTLTISDNGPGIDSSVELKKIKSLGLRLITRLVKQLQGTLEQTNSEGAKFIIHFKDIHIRQAID